MTELTPEQLAEIRRQQSAWNAEFRVRPSKPNIGIEDFCAMHASVTRMLHHIDHQAARIAELEGKVALAKRGLEAVADLINDSDGCAGLHQNGDVAPWMELLTGGRFEEWLIHFDEAHRRLVVEDEA